MAKGHRVVLIAVDSTDDADQVLEAATELYPKGNDSFQVVTVVPPIIDGMVGMSGASFAATFPLQDMQTTITREITESVRERIARYGIPPERLTIRIGRPAAEILSQAEDVAADLIVVGSHGRRGLSRVMLGSTANGVVHGARCDVLMVRIRD
jgi:universal stress protein A